MNEPFNPILNPPFEEPKKYYATAPDGTLDFERIINRRRPYTPEVPPIPIPTSDQKSIFEVSDLKGTYENHIINKIRDIVGIWRNDNYPNTTRVTKELLNYWFKNPDRNKKFFLYSRKQLKLPFG
ncbi:MAG: hypothetical protein KKH32_12255 [Bacteroidetes bacterium]|nr:hypothetical protein [Bacteroidota bacterium]